MLHKINLHNVLFLDIETVPLQENFSDLPETEQYLFSDKTAYQRAEGQSASSFYERAGIWAEFGKIICVSVGYFASKYQPRQFRIKSFSGEEKELLLDFKSLLDNYYSGSRHLLCAHNGKEFDFPYIAQRMLIHQIALPKILSLHGKKPWEIPHLDTMHLWRFGDFKQYTSLKLLAHVFGIPSPKDDIDGSQVAQVYYQEKDIERIVRYCEKDVVTVAQVLLKMRQEPLLSPEEIEFNLQ
ncbi:MAG: 3'-5' exonuclease [Flavobacteriales bacterium]|nr:3'-5' exonuclease [Flavobacteriales bacterium]